MKYKVHSAEAVTVAVSATTEKGTKVEAQMPGLAVELLPEDGGKTLSLDITEENWGGVPSKEMFARGNTVEVGFTLVSKAPTGE